MLKMLKEATSFQEEDVAEAKTRYFIPLKRSPDSQEVPEDGALKLVFAFTLSCSRVSGRLFDGCPDDSSFPKRRLDL